MCLRALRPCHVLVDLIHVVLEYGRVTRAAEHGESGSPVLICGAAASLCLWQQAMPMAEFSRHQIER